jgi:SulP family sulfate permease
MLKKLLPFLNWRFAKGDLRADFLAGLTVALVLIPQSMAYAELAGLPVWMGLYGAVFPVMLAGLWGSSKHLQSGPGATMGLIIASVLAPLAVAGSEEYIQLAIYLGFMVGVIWMLVAVFRLGFIINFLSRPVIEGFINAGGILICASQLRQLLGVKNSGEGHIISQVTGIMGNLNEINYISLTIGVVALVFILLGRRFYPKLPSALIAASFATALVYFLGLSDPDKTAASLSIVGAIPAGLPKPVWPMPDGDTALRLLPGALIFAFVGFLETCSVARGVAVRSHQKLNINQEAVGQSLASFAAAFSGAQPINGSFSRSALNFASGARSGLSTVFTGFFVLLFLLFLTPAFYHLPKSVLSAIIIAAVVRLMNFRQLISFLKVNRYDGIAAWVTFAGTLAFAPALEKGILLGATVSILLHLYGMMKPHVAILGQHPDGALRDVDLHHLPIDAAPLPIRLDGRLFFANVAYVEDQVHAALDRVPEAKHVAIIFQGINEIDSSGTEMLKELQGQLKHRGVELLFIGVKNQLMHAIQTSGLEERVGKHNFFGTLEHAREEIYSRPPSDLTFVI